MDGPPPSQVPAYQTLPSFKAAQSNQYPSYQATPSFQAAQPTQGYYPTTTISETQPLILDMEDGRSLQEFQEPATEEGNQTYLGRWIVDQWNQTVAFECLSINVKYRDGVPKYSWRGVPLLYLAMIVGVTVAAVVDGLVYSNDDDDDDNGGADVKSGTKIGSTYFHRHRYSTDFSDVTHQYTWFHVLLAVIIFDIMYALNAYRDIVENNLPTWRCQLQYIKAICVLTSQVLFFLDIFGAIHVSPFHVCVPLILWTLLQALRLQWQALLGLLAILVSLKLSDSIQWSWTATFVPMWILLLFMLPLVLLLPGQYGDTGTNYLFKYYWFPQAFFFLFVSVLLVIQLDDFPDADGSPSTNSTLDGQDDDDDDDDDNLLSFKYWKLLLIWLVPVVFFIFHWFFSCQRKQFEKRQAEEEQKEQKYNEMVNQMKAQGLV
ncbi:unnamed protein product [Aphanomyces euteiches]|uniref:Transmembrane protein n=1 Tax=Aphanomyces euteiches TaxID=100861 RepID=A0A6G0X5J0_9STRA|nr:hypothetical protein Ae201684_008153 [Aphanomyces euteiches]KAH9070074.1 hypothetical protein Ae201684P_002444 [Aphanomyces euteiches]KAH9098105.1 hypothetical protein LEN26_016726 [Aphanomyces euteiches]KAH9126772.1 hypothetical protein AeMF1_002820 [Aphanomyces euteiches]KAH9155373.1 hypothetical protein AeRB84_002649 [Aphanomyces euteiches]